MHLGKVLLCLVFLKTVFYVLSKYYSLISSFPANII